MSAEKEQRKRERLQKQQEKEAAARRRAEADAAAAEEANIRSRSVGEGEKRKSERELDDDDTAVEEEERGSKRHNNQRSPMKEGSPVHTASTSAAETSGDDIDVGNVDMDINLATPPRTSSSKSSLNPAAKSFASAPENSKTTNKANTTKSTVRLKSKKSALRPKGSKVATKGGVAWGKGIPIGRRKKNDDGSLAPANPKMDGEDNEGSEGSEGSEGWEEIPNKKQRRKTSLGTSMSKRDAPKPPPEYKFEAFVDLWVWIAEGRAAGLVLESWEDTLASAMEHLKLQDPAICLLQPDDSSRKARIYQRSDFPALFRDWKRFVRMENDNADVLCMPTPPDRNRRTLCTVLMGFSNDPKIAIPEMRVDLAKVQDFRLEYKNLQCWCTKRNWFLMYAPNRPPMEVIAAETRKLLSDCETKWKSEHPHMWPESIHGGEFPKLHCILDWGKGGKYVEKPANAPREDTSHRKLPTFIYDGEDEPRLEALFRECKRLGLERDVFGEHAFFQPMLDRYAEDGEKERFNEKVMNHGAVQKSLGHCTLAGLKRVDYKITVELLPDADGPRQSPGDYSIRNILMKMKAGRSRLWQCILPDRHGGYTGYFPGTDPAALSQATNMASDPAGYLKCYLIRQGWKMQSIRKLIQKSFTEEHAENSRLAKWDKANQRVISGASIRHAEHNAALDASFIDRSLGQTQWEKEQAAAMIADQKSNASAAVHMSRLEPGSMGGFAFDEEDSIKTKRTTQSTKTYAFDADSKYSINTDASMDWEGVDDSNSPQEKAKMGEVEVELPAGGLDDDDGKEASSREDTPNSSDSSEIAPSNLNNKFGSAHSHRRKCAKGKTRKSGDSQGGDDSFTEDSEWEEDVEEVYTYEGQEDDEALQSEVQQGLQELNDMKAQLEKLKADMLIDYQSRKADLEAQFSMMRTHSDSSNPAEGSTNRADTPAGSGQRLSNQGLNQGKPPPGAETQGAGKEGSVPPDPG